MQRVSEGISGTLCDTETSAVKSTALQRLHLSLPLQLNAYISIRVDHQMHGTYVFIEKLSLLSICHGDPGRVQRFRKHVPLSILCLRLILLFHIPIFIPDNAIQISNCHIGILTAVSSEFLPMTAKIILKVTVINIGTITGHEETSTNIIISNMIKYLISCGIILKTTTNHNPIATRTDIITRAISSKITIGESSHLGIGTDPVIPLKRVIQIRYAVFGMTGTFSNKKRKR